MTDLTAIRDLTDHATPGPWRLDAPTGARRGHVMDADGNPIASCGQGVDAHADAAFIAAARTAIPALLAEIDRLRGRVQAVDRAVQLREEMAGNYIPLLPLLDLSNPAEPIIFGTVEQEFGSMYAEPTGHADPASFPPGAKRAAAQMLARPPAALAREFPAELGGELDSADPELAGFLARADTDGRMRVTDIDGPQILARLAVDRGYAKGLYHGGTVYQLQLTDLGRQFAGGAQ